MTSKEKRELISAWREARALQLSAMNRELEKTIKERDAYRNVLEGAEYQMIHNIPQMSLEDCRRIGEWVAQDTKRIINELAETKAELKFLYKRISNFKGRGVVILSALDDE